MRNPAPPFGEYIRAARLGWHWHAGRRMWLRMSDLPADRFLVEVAPRGGITADATPSGEHRCWWEGADGGEKYLSLCAPLRGLEAPSGYRSWVVGMDGEAAA